MAEPARNQASGGLQAPALSGFISQQLRQRTLGAATAPARLGVPAATVRLAVASSQALSYVEASRAASTMGKRDAAGQQFSAWLASQPGAWNITLENCTPDHVCLFASEFSTSHGRTERAGRLVCSPSYLSTTISSLSMWFQHIGRSAPWTTDRPDGNPCDSALVRSLCHGYQRISYADGYSEVSAVPMELSKHEQLLAYLDRKVMTIRDPIEMLLALRDACIFSYLWQSAMRGADVGRLTLSCFEQVGTWQRSGSLCMPCCLPPARVCPRSVPECCVAALPVGGWAPVYPALLRSPHGRHCGGREASCHQGVSGVWW